METLCRGEPDGCGYLGGVIPANLNHVSRMADAQSLQVGSGGQWEVRHYRKQIAKRNAEGAPTEVVEALHRKLQRAIDKHGDPDAAQGES